MLCILCATSSFEGLSMTALWLVKSDGTKNTASKITAGIANAHTRFFMLPSFSSLTKGQQSKFLFIIVSWQKYNSKNKKTLLPKCLLTTFSAARLSYITYFPVCLRPFCFAPHDHSWFAFAVVMFCCSVKKSYLFYA